MKLIDIAKYSFKSLRQRHIRSWLTVLGIVIGIASIFSLLTIGQGFSDELERQLSTLGANTIFILPVAQVSSSFSSGGPALSPTSGKLFEKDAERLKKIPEIEVIAKLLLGRGTIDFKDKEITATVRGIEPGVFEQTTSIEIGEGRFLLENDRDVAVLGSTMASESFGNNKVGVNSFITINNKKFRIVGILKKASGTFDPSAQLDTAILIPFKDAQEIFQQTLAEKEVSGIAIRLREGSNADEVGDKVTSEMAASHKLRVEEKDFSVVTPKTIQDAVSSIVNLLTIFLGAIASISLVVGGVGIANSMFTSVLERTHEIGVLKAVGATRSDILKIFIFESAALGGMGGLLGIMAGVLLVSVINLFGFPISIRPEIVLFTFLFSCIIGIISGYIPARNASNLSPVEALRYE